MRLLHWALAWLMRGIEERMIARLLRQRDAARLASDHWRLRLGLKSGEFTEDA